MRYTNKLLEVKNMKISNKGQGAMEYLMTYGWAILVVMIVGVVLWQLGVFTGSGSTNKATGFATGKIGAIDASIKCNTTGLTVTMTNQAGVALSTIVATATGGYITVSAGGFGASNNMTAGSKAMMTVTGGTAKVVGDRVTTDVSVTFSERVAGDVISRTQAGTILCTVEA